MSLGYEWLLPLNSIAEAAVPVNTRVTNFYVLKFDILMLIWSLSNRNGHGCMLQYALLHLFGYDVSMDDLKAFRVSPTRLFYNI